MSKNKATSPQQRQKKLQVLPFVTLAWWQVRPTWRLLLVMGIGIIIAVAFVCTVPLYSGVSMTAGLRNVLTSPSPNADIVVSSQSEYLDTTDVGQATQSLNTIFSRDLGTLVNPVHLSIQTPDYPLLAQTKGQHGQTQYSPTQDVISLISAPNNSLSSHVTVLHGRLPQTSSNAIEVNLTAESAAQLHVRVGSTLTIQIIMVLTVNPQNTSSELVIHAPVRVVGIINPTSADDPYWHSTTFLSTYTQSPGIIYTGLTSSEGYQSYFSQFFSTSTNDQYLFQQPYALIWYYSFNTSTISIYDLDGINNGIKSVQADVGFDYNLINPPSIEQPAIQIPSDTLQRFSARLAVVAIPTGSLLLVVVGLILFFVSLINSILIERQSETIALLRSRGASRRQVFGVFATQSLGLGVIGLLLGPVLAAALVWFIALFAFSPVDRGAVDILFTNVSVLVVRLGWYPLLAALVAVCTSVVAIAQRVSSTMLSLRRETARSTQRTLLQRFNLDILAVVVAVVGFVFLEYLLNTGLLNTQLNLLLLTPLTLLSIFFLAVAGILLFMRLYPLLLRLSAWVTMRSRSAAPMLALAQMARVPRQSVRTTLLLSLATACMLFLLIFMASQSQRIADVAAYQTGADISGIVRDNGVTAIDRSQLTAQYRHVPGVLSASVGYVTTAGASVGSTYLLPMQVNAVDSNTFAQTALWPQQNAAQPLSTLMKQFIAQRNTALASGMIPAVVDAAMWQALQLTPGAHFTLLFNNGDVINGSINFVAMVEVNHIPMINDSTVASDTTEVVTDGGMMVDYETFAQVYTHDFVMDGVATPINYVWLKTSGNNVTLQHIRDVLLLNTPKSCCVQLLNMYDRRAIAVNLQNDPLYLDITGLLSIGTLITIVLLLLGNLIASWLNVRNRLAQFAVLHALGATSRQVSSILVWEQGISYVTGIVLGLLFGFLLAIFLLPSLVYTGVVSSGVGSDLSTAQFYLVQNAPPIQVVLPPWLLLLLVVLLFIFAATLMLIIRVITKPSSAQTLRLNVD